MVSGLVFDGCEDHEAEYDGGEKGGDDVGEYFPRAEDPL